VAGMERARPGAPGTAHWPADSGGTVLETTVGGVLRDAAAAAADRPALVEGSPDPASRRRWTFGDLREDSERAARALLGRLPPAVSPDDPAMILYTSGTTGFPKGAVLHHRGVTNNGRLCVQIQGAEPGDAVVNPMPLFHVGGCVLAVLGRLQCLGPHVLMGA